MGNCCIKVRRRGFNYYTDYMERYFEKAAVHYGYHLVKRWEQAERYCLTLIGDPHEGGQKWMIFMPHGIIEIAHEQVQGLACVIAESFKSESIVQETDEDLDQVTQRMKAYLKGESDFHMTQEQRRKYGTPYFWLFSREYSAFDEPPFMTEGETILRNGMHDVFCVSGRNFLLGVHNFGGFSKGLIITVSFDTASGDAVELEKPTLLLPHYKDGVSWERLPLEFQRRAVGGRTVFEAELPDFGIPEGVNVYSAKLCGKKKHDEISKRSFSLMFMPQGDQRILGTMEIEVIPQEYPANKAVFKIGE